MVLQVKDNGFNFFCNVGIPANTANTYATAFVNNCITETSLIPPRTWDHNNW